MNVAMLIVEGQDDALESLKGLLGISCDSQWEKGDSMRSGKIHELSGFNCTIVDAQNPKELTNLIRSFLVKCKENNIIFPKLNLSGEISIGFTVGDSKQYLAGVDFTPSDMQSFAECGISLSVTAYPTSDEVNVDDEST